MSATLRTAMLSAAEILAGLPVPAYATDADGFLTYYNDAAAEFWGRRPELGIDRWCGALRLRYPDGRPMPPDASPLAVSLREGVPVLGVHAVAERPDGSRIRFTPITSLVRDEHGTIVGAVGTIVDESDRNEAEIGLARLAAIVASSDDAIVSKTLDGIITSWNAGATRIFGYEAAEMIGQPISRIIPQELLPEEAEILARLSRGERIEHFDTMRVAKGGRRLSISLTVSPIRDGAGNVVGASKVARDVTDRKQSEERQRLLLGELNHRVKNTLATIQAIARQSLRAEPSPGAFVASFTGRLQALARAHDLLVRGEMQRADLTDLVREQVDLGGSDPRVTAAGPPVVLDSRLAVQLALVLHELATNARKYGALSVPNGRLAIGWSLSPSSEPELAIDWKESGVPEVAPPTRLGFGTLLIERSLVANGGRTEIRYRADGIDCSIRLLLPPELPQGLGGLRPEDDPPATGTRGPQGLVGRRILVVEDEPLIAMDIEEKLLSLGCTVIGPAPNPATARRLIAETAPDAALLDANLSGQRVDELALELRRRAIPFAFATGFGRESLPPEFGDAPILAKPFDGEQLVAMVRRLLQVRPTDRISPVAAPGDPGG
ncbi:MAG: PAS domain S-box protein [Amaricoccus sp.]